MKSERVTADPLVSFAHLTKTVGRRVAWCACALTSAVILGLAVGVSHSAQAQTFTVLYRFAGYPTDGAKPIGGLIMNASGNLYGTTTYGGNATCVGSGIGCGTVFKLDNHGVETVLHNFRGLDAPKGVDGEHPIASLFMDAKGDLYGTTRFGGGRGCPDLPASIGCGVVFKVSGKKETVLYRFTGGRDGADPWGGVVMDASGALYGTTYRRGDLDNGVVFKLAGKKESVLHTFAGVADGANPTAGLLMDSKGDLYGTASSGGDSSCVCGVVFKLAGKKETVLHAFNGTPDGDTPYAAVSTDAKGNLYGTTVLGGNSYNLGTVFEVSRVSKERVLYRFGPPLQHAGFAPYARVIRDAEGNLYGTTSSGGDAGYGIVFEVSKDGKEKVLHNFCSAKNCADGAYPGDLIMDAQGNIYGTAYGGGINANGTVFMITPQSR